MKRRSANPAPSCQTWWRAISYCGPDGQGRRAGRRYRHLSPGGAPLHRQADRAGTELRRAGRHRHREHAAAQRAAQNRLQQQTATADVLKVISSSPGKLEPVFKAILASATQICQAEFGTLNLFENNAFRSVALHNPPTAIQDALGDRYFIRIRTAVWLMSPGPNRSRTSRISGPKNHILRATRPSSNSPILPALARADASRC